MTSAADSFGAFEHAGWQKVAARYDGLVGQLTTQCVEPMLEAVGARRGVALLDVATGPGYLAAAAASRRATATGVDFSSTMVEQARSRHPHARFQEGNAESLPFPDASFEAVTIGFGLLHFPDPEKALAEACRVLRKGDRLAFTVWAAADKAVGFGLVAKAVQAHGNLNVGLPDGAAILPFQRPGGVPEDVERTRLRRSSGRRDTPDVALPFSGDLDRRGGPKHGTHCGAAARADRRGHGENPCSADRSSRPLPRR